MATRQCAYCGTFVDEGVERCPQCREKIPEKVDLAPRDPAAGHAQIRRGLLYMLFAAVGWHFLQPEASLPPPIELHVPEWVNTILLPCLFLLGLGYGLAGAAKKIGLWT
jgi:hypothetical protein